MTNDTLKILQELARRCLWIAYCWNDHNFDAAYGYARETAKAHGINSLEDANALIEQMQRDAVQPAAPQLAKKLQSFRGRHQLGWAVEDDQLIVDCVHALLAAPHPEAQALDSQLQQPDGHSVAGASSEAPTSLLPCPFCGSSDVSRSIGMKGDGSSWPYIECHDCAACAEIDAWNKRAAQSSKALSDEDIKAAAMEAGFQFHTIPEHAPIQHTLPYEFSERCFYRFARAILTRAGIGESRDV